jgi:hypothetical protein
LITGIDRHQNPADHSQGKLQIDPFRDISRPYGHIVSPFNAYGHKPFGNSFAVIIKIPIILPDTEFGMDKGEILRIARRRFPNYLADCFMDKAGHKSTPLIYCLEISEYFHLRKAEYLWKKNFTLTVNLPALLPLNVNWVKYNRN